MIERVRTGLVTAIVAAAAFGALAAPAAEAATTGPAVAAATGDGGPTGKPKTDCIWMWTVKEPVCHWQ
jgi:hypothetical protein